MSIIDKISTIKAVSNLVVLRSKYDKVCDELAYRELDVNRLKDEYAEASKKIGDLYGKNLSITKELINARSIITSHHKRFDSFNLEVHDLKTERKDLRREIKQLVCDNGVTESNVEILKQLIVENKYLRYLWVLIGFALGVFTWAMIIKYLFV